MRFVKSRLFWAAALALLLTAFYAGNSFAEWHSLLNEHFNLDQRVAANRWPWYTVAGRIRWHWNPWPPYPLAEQTYTDHCWGLQDLYYNSHITRDEEQWEHMSLWCARTNHQDVNHPFYPDEDLYQNDQNAWVWWGPIDLRRAVKAAVSYWYYLELDHPVLDSMTVCVFDPDHSDYITADDDKRNEDYIFHDNVPWGRVHKTNTEDWTFRSVYMDSLYIAPWAGEGHADSANIDTLSVLGEDNIWFAFVWQSDHTDIAGRGAFVDDVIMSWDDGLFDLYPRRALFGYQVTEDSIHWTVQEPTEGESIYFGLEWNITGSEGPVPEFGVECALDGNRLLSERRSITVDPADTTSYYYFSRTDSLWTVPADSHFVKWTLDVDREVEESSENNNVMEMLIFNVWNPAPQFEFLVPAADTLSPANSEFRVRFNISDSLETDNSFTILMYWTKDTTGFAANPDSVFSWSHWFNFYYNINQPRGEGFVYFPMFQLYEGGAIDTNDVLFIAVMVNDREPANVTWELAPGKVTVGRPLGVEEPVSARPTEFGLTRAYPNPFNHSVTLEYGLATTAGIRLAAYDLAGREIALLANGRQAAGLHRVQWTPTGQPGGIYMVKLEAGGKVYLQKAVYMP
jgi:hypothetical protein